METEDGMLLHERHWLEGSGRNGCVVLVHGVGEHLGRYEHVADYLNSRGWHVMGCDQRGHGNSAGQRGDIPRVDSFLSDLGRVVVAARRRAGGGRVLILGHSMGAMIAARFVAEGLVSDPAYWHQPVDGLVLSSPPFQMGLNPFQKMLLMLTRSLMPHLPVPSGLKAGWISSDPEVVAAYLRDPLVHDRVTATLVEFIRQGAEDVLKFAQVWRTPTLLMWGGADQCLDPNGSDRFTCLAPASVLTAKRFDDMAHEIFNEPDRSLVFQQLSQWLTARFG